MNKIIFVFITIIIASTSLSWSLADCTDEYSCIMGFLNFNDLTCKLSTNSIQPACTSKDGIIAQCVTNATATETTKCQCHAGYYALNSTCPACPADSYSASPGMVNSCTPCTSGKTSSGTGRASICTANCSNSDNVDIWKTPVWNSSTNSVDNVCTIETCDTGYHKNDDGNACVGNAYSIAFNTNYGTSQSEKTGCTYGKNCNWSNTTSKNGYTFVGWAATNGGTTSVTAPPHTSLPATFESLSPPSHNTQITLYAIWSTCPNSTNVSTWQQGTCTITACNAGYFLTTSSCPTTDPTTLNCCKTCTDTVFKGEYCPGGNPTSPTFCNGQPRNSDNRCNCEIGYYCTGNGQRTSCPGGMTTSAIKQTATENCFIKGGDAATCENQNGSNNCTKFCDSRGCFYLPSNVYHP